MRLPVLFGVDRLLSMRRDFVRSVLCASLIGSAAVVAVAQSKLMPLPAELSRGSGSLRLTSGFKVETPGSHDARLDAAIARAVGRVQKTAALRGASVPLVVRVKSAGQAVQGMEEDESYSLTVTSERAVIDANTDVGAMHGLETLIQLVQPAGQGFEVPAVTVHDAPRFAWRGLMIDCSRHFEPIEVIKRNIDGMAAVKLNVFHWHLIDDQGFRMESKVFPKLTSMGSDGKFYTQEQVKDVVAYARARGIRVVPEFEMPGHSAAWLYAYPELGSGTKVDGIRREFGVSNTALDPTREETYIFIRKFLTEVTPLFPDAYVHIGGDESPALDWKTNPRILAFKKQHGLKDNDALQAYFNTRVLEILTSLNKRMMGWDEILTPSLPKNIVVQSWRGAASLAKGAQMGYEGVLSSPYYLDGMKPAGVMYLADPVPADTTLTAAEQKRILGGETAMWAEHLNETDIDSRIWPRAAAIAERFWSPRSVTNVDDMYARLDGVSQELQSLGLTHLQSGDARLRTLAGSSDIADLQTIAAAMQPVSFGDRYHVQHTSQLTNLNRFVDAVRPDPPSQHWNNMMVSRCIAKDAAACNALHDWYAKTEASIPHAKQQMLASPEMSDVAPMMDTMQTMLELGQAAASALASGRTDASLQMKKAVLAPVRYPPALVRFTFQESLTKLVNAASGQ